MNIRILAVAVVGALLGACRTSGPQTESESAREEVGKTVAHSKLVELEQENDHKNLHNSLPPTPAEVVRLRNSPEYWRRNAIESLALNTQILMVIPRDESSLTQARPDGLLQRIASLEVVTVFVGEQSAPIVHPYEIVAPKQSFMLKSGRRIQFERQAFMSREPKAQIVYLKTCLEEDGEERRVVFRAFFPSPKELQVLKVDAKKYRPQNTTTPNPCRLGTVPAIERWAELFSLEEEYKLLPNN